MKKTEFSKNNIKDLTPEQIEAFKKEYGKVVRIKSQDGKYKCYLHKPSRIILDLADSVSTKKDRTSMYNETIVKNCWLAGDKEMLEDDDYFMGTQKQLHQIISVKEAELEEL